MENFLQIIIIAILAEAVWENLKMIWQQGKISIDKIGALIISIVITLSTQLDVFAILNFKISRILTATLPLFFLPYIYKNAFFSRNG